MNNTLNANWIPFAKPIKYRNTDKRQENYEGWLLAWRPYYQEHQKAFELVSIEGIEYLDHAGDIINWEDVELIG
jgi:hypothetical protein